MSTENPVPSDDRKIMVSNRSDIVDEIISRKPSFIVSWATTIFGIIILGFLTATWFIRFPDIVTAPAKISSFNSPKQIVPQISGKLVKLFVKENDTVEQNQILGYMESLAEPEDIIQLSSLIDIIISDVQIDRYDKVWNIVRPNAANLGELQEQFQVLQMSSNEFAVNIIRGGLLENRRSLAKDSVYLQEVGRTLLDQESLFENDFQIQKKIVEVNQHLKDQKAISEMDLRLEQSKEIGKKLTLPTVKLAILNNRIASNQNAKSITELDSKISEKKNLYIQSLTTFKSQITEWKKRFIISAPIAGKVTSETLLQENQQLSAGQTFCYVTPLNAGWFCEVVIPQINFGKVHVHQKVLVGLDSYAYQEFGYLRGEIVAISNVPSVNGYFAQVAIDSSYLTKANSRIQIKNGLTGIAKIVISDMRLMERFYYNILRKIDAK